MADVNIYGLVIGLSTFLIIGLFHPLVIKCEYHWVLGVGGYFWWRGYVGLLPRS